MLGSALMRGAAITMWTRQSKTIFAGGKEFALPRLFFRRAGIWYRRAGRVREECAADSFLDFRRRASGFGKIFRSIIKVLFDYFS